MIGRLKQEAEARAALLGSTITPEKQAQLEKYPYYADYKVTRLNEMADMWKGKVFEPYTVPLLAMLLVENTAMDPSIRGDCSAGGCYAFGLSQHHICHRYTFGKKYCYWRGGKHPQQQVEELYPEFSFDWRSQFYQFSDVIRGYIKEGLTADQMIRRWNPREYGRREKVRSYEEFVTLAIST